jgi:5-deoxy-glucuronate isomerase
MMGLAMLADTLFRVPRSDGLELLQRRGERGARELTTHRLRLSGGGSVRWTVPDEETVVALQEGRGTLSTAGRSWSVSRTSVFTERATALLLPPGRELTVTADTLVEAILISTPAPPGGEPVLFRPEDVQVNRRGRGTYSREVHDICVRDPHARRIMVGETFNPPGHWSSFPPHKHDGRDGEPCLEEIYYYRVNPPHGFGHQMLYTADGESVTHEIRDGDAVLLPYGYHPVCSPPGYELYYLWALAGDQRRLAMFEDPAHSWIHNATL